MGFRFRRKIRILPGVSVNVGRSGVTSVSTGVRGFTVNWGKKGTRTTTGVPGTGLSYQSKTTPYQSNQPATQTPSTRRAPVVWLLIGVCIALFVAGKCSL
jgi:hypothetical protein